MLISIFKKLLVKKFIRMFLSFMPMMLEEKIMKPKLIIAFKIISMLNEYKLASLHFISDNEASLIEGLEILLEHQILKNSMLKITAYPKSEKEVFILEHLGFVKNKQDGNIIEYKITKPIYMKGR